MQFGSRNFSIDREPLLEPSVSHSSRDCRFDLAALFVGDTWVLPSARPLSRRSRVLPFLMCSRSFLAQIHANGVAAAETHEPATLSEFEQVLQSFGSGFAIHSQCRIRVEAIPETHGIPMNSSSEPRGFQSRERARSIAIGSSRIGGP